MATTVNIKNKSYQAIKTFYEGSSLVIPPKNKGEKTFKFFDGIPSHIQKMADKNKIKLKIIS